MKQTPVHEIANPDLLALMPHSASRIIEIGCSSGALAREFKAIRPGCHYVGCDIDPTFTEMARSHCDSVEVLDADNPPLDFFDRHKNADLWVFGDSLEHLRDPWKFLSRVRKSISNTGAVVACIPNAQHWSVILRLAIGEFRYEESGLLDRTHLRWFTRKTIIQMFTEAGFDVEILLPRIFNDSGYELFLPMIEDFAEMAGSDVKEAANDSKPLQYVIRAKPRP